MLRTPARRSLVENAPFGNSRTRNFLKDYKSEEQGATNSVTKVLFQDCSDLLNTFHATIADNFTTLHINLHSVNPSVLAWNVLMLEIISSPSFNQDNEEDFAFLWDVWYNAEWPQSTKTRFQSILSDLLAQDSPFCQKMLTVPQNSHLQSLKEVWAAWNSVCLKTSNQSKQLVKKIWKERPQFIWKLCEEMYPPGKLSMKAMMQHTDMFSVAVEGMAEQLEIHVGLPDLTDSLSDKIREEADRYFKSGNCRLQTVSGVMSMNPTLLDPNSLKWEV